MRTIDVHSEQIVPLDDYVRLRPPGRNGKRMHKSTGYRHAKKGVRGWKLPTIVFGGVIGTSREAIQDFLDVLSSGSTAPASSQPSPTRSESRANEDAARLFA